MPIERDLVPLHERQAARAAIEVLVRETGSQSAAGVKLGVSQNAINKALVHTKVGPVVVRNLLDYLGLDIAGLLEKFGDPATRPAPKVAVPLSPKEEAILTAVRFAGGAPEAEVRAIADEYDTILKNAEPIDWLETLLNQVQRRILIPQREARGAERRMKSEQRSIRKLHDVVHTEPAPAASSAPRKRAAR